MAYRKTRQDSVEFENGRINSIGGFFGADVQSSIKIVSPNGTVYYIVVDNAGVLSTQTSAT